MRYNKSRDFYGKGTIDDPCPIEKKKSSFTKVLLIGLLVFFAGSLGYDYLKTHNLFSSTNSENPIQQSSKEDVAEETSMPFENDIEEISSISLGETNTAKKTISLQKDLMNHQPNVSGPTNSPSTNPTSTQYPRKEDYRGLSTSEILDRTIHANVVRSAREAGVSTEGSTSEILDRITHASVVRSAREAGVSAEGSTSEILDRITHASVVRSAREAGVSTEGSTSEILDRITRKNLEKYGY